MTGKRSIALIVCLVILSLMLASCELISPAPSGSVLFQDDFSSTSSGWSQSEDSTGIAQYVQGAFRLAISKTQAGKVSTPGLTFSNVRLETDTIPLGGPQNNNFGLVCRYQDDQNFYFFTISSDRYFGIGKYKDGKLTLLGNGQMQTSDAIHEGNSPNHLRFDCVGDRLTGYSNGVELLKTQDSDIEAGDIGIIAGTLNEPGVDILFDHFTVFQP
jgi:hypothetical protein